MKTILLLIVCIIAIVQMLEIKRLMKNDSLCRSIVEATMKDDLR